MLSIGRNAFQSGQYSNGGRRCTQLLMNLSLFFINSNFVNQLLGRKDIGIARYFGITIVIIEHLNKVVRVTLTSRLKFRYQNSQRTNAQTALIRWLDNARLQPVA